jgi:hypothetical protein
MIKQMRDALQFIHRSEFERLFPIIKDLGPLDFIPGFFRSIGLDVEEYMTLRKQKPVKKWTHLY